MTKKNSLLALFILAFVTACGGPGEDADIPEAEPAGETMKNIGGYVVHFSAQSTDQLSPEIARAYNIVRSKNRAMLNVSVIRESDNESVEADVQVKTVNLTGQLKNVAMRKVPDQEAIKAAVLARRKQELLQKLASSAEAGVAIPEDQPKVEDLSALRRLPPSW